MQTVLAGATVTVALIALCVRLLGAVGLLTTWMLFGALVVVAGAVVVAVRKRGVPWRQPWRHAMSGPTVPVLLFAAVAVGIAVVAAYYLPVWQWDAVGYHLPLVNFALQRGRFADIPPDMPYVSTYPHIVEYMFIGWRAMLPDDRLVELAGISLGLTGALAVACIARGQGARTEHAVAAGVAIGLFLGAKPTALLGAFLLLAELAFRARRDGVPPAMMPRGSSRWSSAQKHTS